MSLKKHISITFAHNINTPVVEYKTWCMIEGVTFCFFNFLLGTKPEYSVAEVWLQQGGLYKRFMSEAEGQHRAGLDACDGLHQHWIASSGDFQAQRFTGGENEGVCTAC